MGEKEEKVKKVGRSGRIRKWKEEKVKKEGRSGRIRKWKVKERQDR